VLVLNDMTELRLLQEKQRQFVTNVSHELKTPLTTIMGYIDLLAEKGGDREVFEKSVKYLSDASDRLTRLVNDLIDLSSISKFEFEIEPRSTDLSALVRDITGQMSLKAQKFGIKISTDLPATPEILVDPVRIKQAMVNILDNAIKYSPGGTISVSIKEDTESIIITVRDSGCGIPEDMLEKVFEPFYRVDKARSRNMGGNGLGLVITKEIIEKHMGKVNIESRVGKGTTVRLILPKQ
jgi:two-component system phosphate regulon sensor histidine kinase PhoR